MELPDILVRTNATAVQAIGYSGKGVVVAVLDSGIDVTHEFFSNNVIKSFSVIGQDPKEDINGHGTHVASILVAIAPEISILNVQILDEKGETKFSKILKGIEVAIENGADIINISVGDVELDCPDDFPLSKMVEYAQTKGINVVCAAGNEGPRRSPHSPASAKQAIAVGSMNSLEQTNKWSSGGPNCKRKYPDCVAFGDNVVAAIPGNEYGVLSGTSQAAPQVSGMLALTKQAIGRSLTREEVELFLERSSTALEDADKNNRSGWGGIDAYKFLKAAEIEIFGL